jgi:hypothetical protein
MVLEMEWGSIMDASAVVRAIAWNWNTIGSGGSLKGTVGLEGAGA